jgi:hypothetical protein
LTDSSNGPMLSGNSSLTSALKTALLTGCPE